MNALGIARADRGRHDTCRDLHHCPYTDQGHRRRARACLASTLDWADTNTPDRANRNTGKVDNSKLAVLHSPPVVDRLRKPQLR